MLFQIVLPVFLIIAIGYLAGSKGIVDVGGAKTLNNFVFYIALPALLFKATATAPLENLLNGAYISVIVGGIATCFILAYIISRWVFKKEKSAAAIYSMGASYGTTGYMGIPLVIAAFGEKAALPASIATLLHNIPVIFLVLILCGESDRGFLALIKPIIKNPLTLAVFAGLLFSFTEIQLPTSIFIFTDLLANASGATALFAIGLGLVNKSLKQKQERYVKFDVSVQLLVKLILHPLVTYALFTFIFDIDPLLEKVALIMAALPVGAGVYVFAQQFKREEDLTLKSIFLSILISVISISIFMMSFKVV
jgi:malonate transporter and related proteins